MAKTNAQPSALTDAEAVADAAPEEKAAEKAKGKAQPKALTDAEVPAYVRFLTGCQGVEVVVAGDVAHRPRAALLGHVHWREITADEYRSWRRQGRWNPSYEQAGG